MGRAPALHGEALESTPSNWAWQSTPVIPLLLRQKEDQEFKAIPRLYFKSQAWLSAKTLCASGVGIFPLMKGRKSSLTNVFYLHILVYFNLKATKKDPKFAILKAPQ